MVVASLTQTSRRTRDRTGATFKSTLRSRIAESFE